jgi:hypothetical protein
MYNTKLPPYDESLGDYEQMTDEKADLARDETVDSECPNMLVVSSMLLVLGCTLPAPTTQSLNV